MTAENSIPEIDVTISEPEWNASYLDVDNVARTAITHTLAMAVLPKILIGRQLEV